YRFKNHRIDEVARIISTQQPERPSTAILANESSSSNGNSSSFSKSGMPTNRDGGRHLLGDLDNIVLMALRTEPARRYRAGQEFSADLARPPSGRPIIARKDALAYRFGRFVTRNKKLVVGGLMIAVACLVLGSFLTLFGVRARARASVAVLPFRNGIGDP